MKTEENLYKYLNILIIDAEIAESNHASTILQEKHIFPVENEKYEYLEFCGRLVSLGHKLKYFNLKNKEYEWFDLTEKGIEAKEKGGHFKYLDFIQNKKLEKIKPTIVAENYIGGNNNGTQSSKKFSNSPIINNTTANPSNDRNKNSIILKFWKLISENKLISSLLLVTILWAIKEIFNINLKI